MERRATIVRVEPRTGPGRLRKTWILVAGGALLVVLAIGTWFVSIRTTEGPLGVSGFSSRVTVPADVGTRLSFGITPPTYRGSDPVVVDSLVPDSVPSGLRVLGYRAIVWGQGCVGGVHSFPPRGYATHPVRGWRVERGQGACLVIGLEPVGPGVFLIRGFTLTYHVGWHNHAAHYQQAVKVCVPSAKYADC